MQEHPGRVIRFNSGGRATVGDWTRWSCPAEYDYAYCNHYTELAPGRYETSIFKPFEGATSGRLA